MGAERFTGRAGFRAALVLVCVAWAAVAARAGDAGNAKRNVTFAKMSMDSQRWDATVDYLKKAQAEMEGLSDAEKAPILAEIAAVKAAAGRLVERDVTQRLDSAAKRMIDSPNMVSLDTGYATRKLDSDEAKNFLDPAVETKLRSRLAGIINGGSPAATRTPPVRPVPETSVKPEVSVKPVTPVPPVMPVKPETPLKPERPGATVAVPPAHAEAIARARFDLGFVSMVAKSQHWDQIEETIRKVEADLEGVPDAEKADVLGELAAYRRQALRESNAETARQAERSLGRILDSAVLWEERGDRSGMESELAKASELLDSEKVQQAFNSADLQKQYARIDAIRKAAPGKAKARAMAPVPGLIKQLEDRLAGDPFKGAEQLQVQRTYSDLQSLVRRILGQVKNLPQDDPDVKAVNAKVAGLQAKVESASESWGQGMVDAAVADNWKKTQKSIAGWEQEEAVAGAVVKTDDVLPKTVAAIRDLNYWLSGGKWLQENREKYKGDAAFASADGEARAALDAAHAKLDAAFNRAMAEADKMPTPSPRDENVLSRPARLAHDVENWFAGTKYKEANAARARALGQKWQAAIAAAQKAAEELDKKLSAEASAAWPKIEASVRSEPGFDPAAAGWKGRTIKLAGVYNRSGWDYDGRYDFALKINGVPVAGNYAPHVRKAFDDSWQRNHLSINDHLPWDVIAVVEGPGKINERITTEVRINDGPEKVKVESLRKEDCVMLRVIAVRAGSVAVGP